MIETTIKTKVTAVKGDITQQDTDAIVNAANSSLLGGGGVDGAIHRAGGPKILEECRAIRARQGGCPTGEAVITSGGKMRTKYVIHTVGPVWYGGNKNESELLRRCYVNSLNLAIQNNIKSISFPSISTGVYGYPVENASEIAVKAVRDFIRDRKPDISEVKFVLFSDQDFEIYKNTLKK